MVRIALSLGLISFASLALAADGVLEINQTCALSSSGCFTGDTQGFPVTITQSGSYRLTSDLSVPAGSDGIELRTNEVALDLNGFGIRSALVCAPILCPAGAGAGVIAPIMVPPVGSGVMLKNGVVSGFAAGCISLLDRGHVEGLLVHDCG